MIGGYFDIKNHTQRQSDQFFVWLCDIRPAMLSETCLNGPWKEYVSAQAKWALYILL